MQCICIVPADRDEKLFEMGEVSHKLFESLEIIKWNLSKQFYGIILKIVVFNFFLHLAQITLKCLYRKKPAQL